ncbi:ribonuclease P protein component [bacterium]|nr:ribonuclease P protein component [bacterium]
MKNNPGNKEYPFSKKRSLRKRNDFLLFSTQKNYRSYGKFLTVKCTKGNDGAKFAFITRKKLGKAHFRNRVRRILREIVRLNPGSYVEGYYYIIYVKETLADNSFKLYSFLREELLNLLMNIKRKIEQDE